MTISFVLGNGRSRLAIDPQLLTRKGKTYGCNAIYRDFIPDYLIAVDPKMIVEINENRVQYTTNVWTNRNSRFKNFDRLNFFEPSKGWSSGPTALLLATMHKSSEIYMLGFDYQGLEGKLNNVYADTQNYRKSTDPATYHGNWSRQTEIIVKEHPEINYYRVTGPNPLVFDWNNQYKNFHNITYSEFKDKFSL
jgi:hypothetical protein